MRTQCEKFCNHTLSVVCSMDIFVLHYMDLRFANYLSLMLCVYIETNHSACRLPGSKPAR